MPYRLCRFLFALLLAVAVAVSGCRARREFTFGEQGAPTAAGPVEPPLSAEASPASYEFPDTQLEMPREEAFPASQPADMPPPWTIGGERPAPWPLRLEEVVSLCLANSAVFREISGAVVRTPERSSTIYGPALQEADPQSGVQAALSAFDAHFSTDFFYRRNEQTINNNAEQGVRDLRQNIGVFRAGIHKRTALGTELSIYSINEYDRNNSPFNLFRSGSTMDVALAFRHPLLKGGGLQFNRIAGPDAQPGEYRGVLVARLDTDIELARFEASLRDLLRDVERAYWELYFAYRRLDAKAAARDAALQTWQLVESRMRNGGADGEQEALARERYYAAEAELENALNGTPVGSPSRTPVASPLASYSDGVYALERRLRYLCGLAANDGRLMRPIDNPVNAEVIFEWYDSLALALWRRVELRQQKWRVQRRELELVASRNQRLIQLDLYGDYGLRGFGDNFFGTSAAPLDSAFHDLTDARLNNWQLGLRATAPIGNRIGHTAVRHAELTLSRERAVLNEQEHQVVHELGNVFSELRRAHAVSRTSYNRRVAAHQQFDAIRAKYGAGNVLLEFVLDAQRRAVSADSDYFRALADYNTAIANVHYARGTFLDYLNVYLAEGPWSPKARQQADRQASRLRPAALNYCLTVPPPVSRGPYPQQAPPPRVHLYPPQPVPESGPETILEPELLPPVSPVQETPGEAPEDEPLRPPPESEQPSAATAVRPASDGWRTRDAGLWKTRR